MKVRKIDKSILIFGCLAAVAGVVVHCSGCSEKFSQKDTANYPLTAVVTKINSLNNTVSVTDGNGFIWDFSDSEDWLEGDVCSMIMNDNGTESIFDDVIVTVRYGGRFD